MDSRSFLWGMKALVEEVMAGMDAAVDYRQFDANGDGFIDLLYLKYTGPEGDPSGMWWSFRYDWGVPFAAFDGVQVRNTVWSWVAGEQDCYEMYPHGGVGGHAFGLPDIYDKDATRGPPGSVGGLNLMSSDTNDMNGFFKWLLGWLTPSVVASGSAAFALRPMSASGDAVMVFPGAKLGAPWSELFWVEYRRRNTGNDEGRKLPTDGLVIWHIDARLDAASGDFRYDNHYTEHKLIRLMEADGLEEIERAGDDYGLTADKGDFYRAGASFTPASNPSSRSYDQTSTRVYVTDIGPTRSLSRSRSSYHATIKAASGAFVASGALVRSDAVLTAGAHECAGAGGGGGCQVTLGPASPVSTRPAEASAVKSTIRHPTANLQLVSLQQCTASSNVVVLAASEAPYRTYRARDWMLTGWKTLKAAASPAPSLAYSYLRQLNTTCPGASAAAGEFCATVASSGAASTGPCAGDKGSPLVYNANGAGGAPATVPAASVAYDTLAGLSIGLETCGRASAPAVFTSVGRFGAWVANNLQARPSPCWTKSATLGASPVLPAAGGPARQVFAPPRNVDLNPKDYEIVEAAQSVAMCTAKCRLREHYGASCKAFSVYSAVNAGGRPRATAKRAPAAAAHYCVFYAEQVPELCGTKASGDCANAVAAWRMTWAGA